MTPRPPSRAWSGVEFLAGAAIVLGHNVWHVVPNEVPILFVLAILTTRLHERRWSAPGLIRPVSWKRVFLIALVAAAVRILLGTLVIDPIAAHYWPPQIAPKGVSEIAGHPIVALEWLALVWTFAAFGEEISYRGFLLNRCWEALGRSRPALWASAVLAAVLFGFGHYYKGPAGIVDSGVAGLVLATAYIVSGRNLWACILAHGFIDTFGVVAAYFGLDS
jgi:membrane protease YdiL (CAAX protease family)